MARRVFVDTSGWYALIDRTDSAHARAVALVDQLIRAGARLVTSDYVLDESYTLTLARLGPNGASRFMDLVERSAAVDTEWITADRFATARAMFRKQLDQGYSFTDCTSFVLTRESRITDAITTDRHFRAAGLNQLLPAAPRGAKIKEAEGEYRRPATKRRAGGRAEQ